MKGRVVRKLKEMGIRKVEGKKLELYNYYTLCMFLDKVEVDTKVLVRDRPNDKWEKRYFAKYVDGKVYVFKEGKTSWNSIGIEHWQETKLYENK